MVCTAVRLQLWTNPARSRPAKIPVHTRVVPYEVDVARMRCCKLACLQPQHDSEAKTGARVHLSRAVNPMAVTYARCIVAAAPTKRRRVLHTAHTTLHPEQVICIDSTRIVHVRCILAQVIKHQGRGLAIQQRFCFRVLPTAKEAQVLQILGLYKQPRVTTVEPQSHSNVGAF